MAPMEESMDQVAYVAFGVLVLCAIALVLRRRIKVRLNEKGLSIDIDSPNN